MHKKRIQLTEVLTFNAVTAIVGGLTLMSGSFKQSSWIAHTDFSSLYFPGVILFALVGGSSLLAALAVYKRVVGWQLASLMAGVIMLFWIVGEVVSIRAFHWLQAVYIVTGGAVILLTELIQQD